MLKANPPSIYTNTHPIYSVRITPFKGEENVVFNLLKEFVVAAKGTHYLFLKEIGSKTNLPHWQGYLETEYTVGKNLQNLRNKFHSIFSPPRTELKYNGNECYSITSVYGPNNEKTPCDIGLLDYCCKEYKNYHLPSDIYTNFTVPQVKQFHLNYMELLKKNKTLEKNFTKNRITFNQNKTLFVLSKIWCRWDAEKKILPYNPDHHFILCRICKIVDEEKFDCSTHFIEACFKKALIICGNNEYARYQYKQLQRKILGPEIFSDWKDYELEDPKINDYLEKHLMSTNF